MTELREIEYIPENRDYSLRLATQMNSAWEDIPTIIGDIIKRFDISTESAIEFGVEWGYSTSALSNYFNKVVGVDTFRGDVHAGLKGDTFKTTSEYLKDFENIQLVQASYQDYTSEERHERYNFGHVDIVHTYEDTYKCGEWCIEHCDVVVFHDTISFPDVYRACLDLAKDYNLEFHNYRPSNGLGILVKK
jgi:hypothetical protein